MIAYWIELALLIVATFLLVRRYSEDEVPLYVKGLVWLSWALTFIIIMILPLDIYEAKEGGENQVKVIWISIYYANFVLTWLVLPIAQEYENAGEFTFKGKLRRSLINNGLLIRSIMVNTSHLSHHGSRIGRLSDCYEPTVLDQGPVGIGNHGQSLWYCTGCRIARTWIGVIA